MLGSASEAEDTVQDAWLRFSRAPGADVRSPEAYLTTIVTRLSLDRLKAARAQREEYIGPWLPEPVMTDERKRPDHAAILSESVTLAFMVVLETLTPEERAVFLLREVFDYTHDEIANVLQLTAANCRQLFHRAKSRIAEGRPRFKRAEVGREIVERFARALADGDAEALTRLLADDVSLTSDGGGKVAAARRPLYGRAAVLNLLLGIRRTATATGIPVDRVALDVVEVNCEPAMVIRVDGELNGVYVCSIGDGSISALRIVRNPSKLAFISRQTSHV
jgi:RNA polymerase sigma-70 factor (ECF subfamily)